MELVVVAIVAALAGLGTGVVLGRASGRSAGFEDGRAKGLEEGRKTGLDEGRAGYLDEGRRLGHQEGHRQGVEEGRARGRDEGRAEGVEEGRAAGRDEGYARGLREGSQKAGAEVRALMRAELEGVLEAVRRGRLPEGGSGDSPAAALRDALAQGWAPRESEREAALREAVGRVSGFLQANVRAPLEGATAEADADELRERVAAALGSLQDLDYFIAEVDTSREGSDLGRLAQTVSREFAADQDVAVRLMLGSAPVRAEVNASALMDALYLILHNAGRFGGGATVDLTVQASDGRGTILVRDRGAGFSEEAFARAFDPFYSTSDAGLGLGLPHARKVIERMGGSIDLRNVPDGGAEVEVSFPLS